MAISGVSNSGAAPVQALQQVKRASDADGDTDGSKAGEVESTASKQPPLPNPTPTMGNNVNVRA